MTRARRPHASAPKRAAAQPKHVAPSCRCPSSKETAPRAKASRAARDNRTKTLARTASAKAHTGRVDGNPRHASVGVVDTSKHPAAVKKAAAAAKAARTHHATAKRSTTALTSLSAAHCKCPKD